MTIGGVVGEMYGGGSNVGGDVFNEVGGIVGGDVGNETGGM